MRYNICTDIISILGKLERTYRIYRLMKRGSIYLKKKENCITLFDFLDMTQLNIGKSNLLKMFVDNRSLTIIEKSLCILYVIASL